MAPSTSALGALSPPMASRAIVVISESGSSGFGDFDHFTILVLPAEHAGAVRKNRLVARRTLGNALHFQMVVRTAHGSAALRMASFRIWHGVSLFLVSFIGLVV